MGSSFCSYFNRAECRSCTWIERDYAAQLSDKEQRIREALGFFQAVELDPPFRSPLQGFRHRAKMAVTGTLDSPVIGLTGHESLDQGRELLDCPIHHPKLNELMNALPELIRAGGLTPYGIRTRQGELKGLIAFYSPLIDQMYLRFVVRTRDGVERAHAILPALLSRFPSLVCVSANLQPIPHAILEGPEEVILTEQAWIEHQCGPVRFRLAPQAFVQTNTEVAAGLYAQAAEWIAEAKPGKMVDLFCGQGAFSFFAARSCPEILGVELNADAVRSAEASARALGHGHVRFKSADATGVGLELKAFGPDLILVNPPRRGLGARGIELLRTEAPRHLIYSSCDLRTLAADLKALSGLYPTVRKARLFDMFPHTGHFETLVWLGRKV